MIRELFVDFVISAKQLDLESVQSIFDHTTIPDRAVSRGDLHPLGYPYPEGMWLLSTRNKLKSDDVNEHIRLLNQLLFKFKDSILNYTDKFSETLVGFHVIWKATNLASGSGPLFNADSIKIIACFNAELIVDCYHEESETEFE